MADGHPPPPLRLNFTFMTRVRDVKTFRASNEWPNGRTRNWNNFPFQPKRMYFLVDGCNGMWKYASRRSMDVAQSPRQRVWHTSSPVSMRKYGVSMWAAFNFFKLRMSLMPPSFLGIRKMG
jgi:hypothetical protein